MSNFFLQAAVHSILGAQVLASVCLGLNPALVVSGCGIDSHPALRISFCQVKIRIMSACYSCYEYL